MRDGKSLGFAKQLRRELTPAEARLWYHLRAKRFSGVKFRRQTVVGPFIADFTCRAAMLVIRLTATRMDQQLSMTLNALLISNNRAGT